MGAKGALFVLTVLAARRFSPYDFGVFALGTTVGWLLSVVTDFGVQLHVARAVAQTPEAAPLLLRQWGRVRIAASLGGLALFALALTAFRAGPSWTVPLLILALAYSATSLVEFLNYFYRRAVAHGYRVDGDHLPASGHASRRHLGAHPVAEPDRTGAGDAGPRSSRTRLERITCDRDAAAANRGYASAPRISPVRGGRVPPRPGNRDLRVVFPDRRLAGAVVGRDRRRRAL
jgi:hypothetical protein